MTYYDKLIFVDYDGTITTQDTVLKSINLFMDPKEAYKTVTKLHEGEITLSEAVHGCFDGLDANLLDQMVDNIKDVNIREGFEEFLFRMDELQIPVVLLSAGFEPLIMSKIGHLKHSFLDMYYGRIDASGETLKIDSDFDDGIELINKQEVMNLYKSDIKIIIGDGLTDLGMAINADVAFARGQLVDMLKDRGVDYVLWNDFFDVTRKIEAL